MSAFWIASTPFSIDFQLAWSVIIRPLFLMTPKAQLAVRGQLSFVQIEIGIRLNKAALWATFWHSPRLIQHRPHRIQGPPLVGQQKHTSPLPLGPRLTLSQKGMPTGD